MRPFNVTQIVPDGYVHAHALDDCAEYLTAMLAACGQRVTRSHNHIDLEAWNVIVGGHLLAAAHVAALPADVIVFNSEQLAFAGNPLITAAYRDALARFTIWDYSATNLPFLPAGRATVIPFTHCPAMVRDRARTPGDALVFHGAVTRRRQVILDGLRTAGVRLEVAFGEYGTARDVRMFGARAILDLRKADDTAAFTPIRCFYPLTNGIPVISESSDDPTAAGFADVVWSFAAKALPAAVAALWTDLPAFRAEADRRLARWRTRSAVDQIAAAVAAHCQ